MQNSSSKPQRPPTDRKSASWLTGLGKAGPYVGTGMQLAGSMMIYVLLGYFADQWFDTQPWLLVAGGVVGMIAFFVELFRLVNRMNADTRRRHAESKHESSDGDMPRS